MPGTRIGNNVKIQNNVSIYEGVELEDDVFCGPSMVFTNVINPAQRRLAEERVPAHARAARRDDRRQRNGGMRRHTGRVCVRRCGGGRHEGRESVRARDRSAC